jgi:hypothetical protein
MARPVHPNGEAPVSARARAAAAQEGSPLFAVFSLLLAGAALALLVVGTLSLPDDTLPAASNFIDARLRSRWRQLNERLHAVSTRRYRLRAEKERTEKAHADHERHERLERRLNERVEWNASSATWVNVGDVRVNASTNDSSVEAATAAAAAALAHEAATALSSAAAKRAALLRSRSGAAAVGLPSPPPPLGPAVLLRAGQEGARRRARMPCPPRGMCVCPHVDSAARPICVG